MYQSNGGDRLRRDLSMFPKLRELFLVEEEDYDVFDTPGYSVLRDNATVRFPVATSYIQKVFLNNYLSGKEMREGVPAVRIVSALRITHIPGDSQERDYGEPFVSTPSQMGHPKSTAYECLRSYRTLYLQFSYVQFCTQHLK